MNGPDMIKSSVVEAREEDEDDFKIKLKQDTSNSNINKTPDPIRIKSTCCGEILLVSLSDVAPLLED